MRCIQNRILLAFVFPSSVLAQTIDYVNQVRTLSVEASAENLDNTFFVESDDCSVTDIRFEVHEPSVYRYSAAIEILFAPDPRGPGDEFGLAAPSPL